ncbi:MAG TPA: EamA family transporter [Vicinamibacterales bacterium]|nr:EamA family transporter [Vicinamibacterales bacterium]
MSAHSGHRWPGVPLAVASAVLFGVSTPIAKRLLGDLPPAMLAGLLYLGSGLGLFLLRRLRSAARPMAEAPIRRRDLPWVGAIVLAGGVIGPLLLMIGLESAPASTASLLLNLEGVFTLGIAWVVFRENADLRIGLGAAAILSAALLLSWTGGTGGVSWRSLAIVGACLAWSIDNNLTRRLSASDPVQLAMIKGLSAGALNTALAIASGSARISGFAVAAAMGVGFVGYGLSLVAFILALRHLGTARTGAYFSFAPFVGASVSIVAFGEPVTPTFVLAAGLMATGLYLHLAERHAHEHIHEPMAHEHRHVHDEHHQHAHGPADPPGEPHTHWHDHVRLVHSHPHYPDLHHRHHH